MNESRDAPPWEGGSGGLLEVVDMMCTVTETMVQIIRKQAEMIERTKMEEAVREELRAAREDADRQLDKEVIPCGLYRRSHYMAIILLPKS